MFYLEIVSAWSKDWDYLCKRYNGREFATQAEALMNARAIEEMYNNECAIDVYERQEWEDDDELQDDCN